MCKTRKTKSSAAAKNIAPRNIHAGKVSTHANMILRNVARWRPERFAAIVPATPEERTCVVLTGNP